MKVFIAILTFIGISIAQSFSEAIPACAGPCISSAIGSATKCGPTDATCVCQVDNYRAIYTAALTCVLNACGSDVGVSQVLPAAEQFCLKAVGPISVSPPSSTTSGATRAATTPAATTNTVITQARSSSSAAAAQSTSSGAANPTAAANMIVAGVAFAAYLL